MNYHSKPKNDLNSHLFSPVLSDNNYNDRNASYSNGQYNNGCSGFNNDYQPQHRSYYKNNQARKQNYDNNNNNFNNSNNSTSGNNNNFYSKSPFDCLKGQEVKSKRSMLDEAHNLIDVETVNKGLNCRS